jgi:hypothetical protein
VSVQGDSSEETWTSVPAKKWHRYLPIGETRGRGVVEGSGPVKCRGITLGIDGNATGPWCLAGRSRADRDRLYIGILAAGVEHLVVVDVGTEKRVILVMAQLVKEVDQLGVESRPGIGLGFEERGT